MEIGKPERRERGSEQRAGLKKRTERGSEQKAGLKRRTEREGGKEKGNTKQKQNSVKRISGINESHSEDMEAEERESKRRFCDIQNGKCISCHVLSGNA